MSLTSPLIVRRLRSKFKVRLRLRLRIERKNESPSIYPPVNVVVTFEVTMGIPAQNMLGLDGCE